MIGMGKVLGAQMKIVGHLENGRLDRVKDYLLTFASIWPDPESCPIDPDVLKKSKLALINAGWELRTNDQDGLVIFDPTGAMYRSHRNGQPKFTDL